MTNQEPTQDHTMPMPNVTETQSEDKQRKPFTQRFNSSPVSWLTPLWAAVAGVAIIAVGFAGGATANAVATSSSQHTESEAQLPDEQQSDSRGQYSPENKHHGMHHEPGSQQHDHRGNEPHSSELGHRDDFSGSRESSESETSADRDSNNHRNDRTTQPGTQPDNAIE